MAAGLKAQKEMTGQGISFLNSKGWVVAVVRISLPNAVGIGARSPDRRA